MGDVIHRTTLVFRRSASESEHPEPTWKHDPDMSGVADPDGGSLYWKAPADWDAVGAGPLDMNQAERDAVDAALLTALRTGSAVLVDAAGEVGYQTRSLIEVLNKRDNYIINRIAELQAALDAVKASSGAAQNIRDAIPASWLATSTRTKPETVQAYKDEITSGNVDS